MADTVADVLLARLREWGVAQVFAYPGDGINGLLAAWGRAQPRLQAELAARETASLFKSNRLAEAAKRRLPQGSS